MISRRAASPILPRVVLVVAVVLAVLTAAHRLSADEAAKAGPATSPAATEGIASKDLGRLGDLIRDAAKEEPAGLGWFTNLSEAEQKQAIADLNTWSIRVSDVVEPK